MDNTIINMKRIVLVVALTILAFPVRVHADEGMWLMSLIEQINMDEMTEMGLELTADQIYSINQASLKDAVGALDGGSCTAELISAEGLLITNHHCGYNEIQYHSSVENNYLKNGFWAMTRDEELPNEGKTITFLIRMEEVTDQILPKLNENMTHQERNSKIRSLSGAITSDATAGTHYEAIVSSVFDENRFFLFVSETYLDVRLVGAPPESIGKYGGDTDNWMWPRHTGDFSLFRVYTGPDGKPAHYSPDNIPLNSKHFLPVSLKGYEKGDFTMVLGFPGRTSRYMTSWEIEELLEVLHPNRIKIRGIKQKLMMEDMLADEKVRIQYASKHAHSANYWKYSIGQSLGLEKLQVATKQKQREEAFTQWINESAERKETYRNALEEIRKAVEGRRTAINAAQYLEETILRAGIDEGGMESVAFARNLRQLERMMADPETDQVEIESIANSLKEYSVDFYKDYNPPTDKKVMVAMIELLMEDLDEQYWPSNITEVKTKYKGNIEKYVDRYFKKSFVVNQEKFNAFLDDPSLKVLRKDPAYQAAIATSVYLELMGQMAEFDESFERGRRLYLKGMVEMHPEMEFYPDANSTMRMNYGTIGDYIPRDAVLFTHFTTLKGVMEKEDPSNFEFFVPRKLKELYEAKDYGIYSEDGKLVVCFTSNNDTTGGNSGSPVINSRGELIGLAFDGNWEAMSGDVAFETQLQKAINVDIRYVLFIMDKFAGAGHLIEEMKLVQ
jgi:hypothetical protein